MWRLRCSCLSWRLTILVHVASLNIRFCEGGQVVVQTFLGSSYKCSILKDALRGRFVKCWGGNEYGQLGQGDVRSRGQYTTVPVDLGVGREPSYLVGGIHHTCALLDNAQAKCWGANYRGQLGQGDMDNRGDAPGEMGNSLKPIAFGKGRSVVELAGGDYHTCARLDNGSVKCWGGNDKGQLGYNGVEAKGRYLGEMGDALPAVPLGENCNASSVIAGARHTCVASTCGRAVCSGVNAHTE